MLDSVAMHSMHVGSGMAAPGVEEDAQGVVQGGSVQLGSGRAVPSAQGCRWHKCA